MSSLLLAPFYHADNTAQSLVAQCSLLIGCVLTAHCSLVNASSSQLLSLVNQMSTCSSNVLAVAAERSFM
jgi:hypothetical protein